MKNVKENQLVKCILLLESEFKEVFTSIFGEYDANTNEVNMEIDAYDGVYFCGISNEEVYQKLSEYFGANITSIHIDQSDSICVWICYK